MKARGKQSFHALLLAGGIAASTTINGSGGQDKPPGQTERPKVTKPEATERQTPGIPTEKPAKPPGRPEASSEMKQQLQKFDSAREAYLSKQRELSDQLRGATLEQKKAVQTQLETLRREWFDRARTYREEAQRRVPDLKDLPRFEVLGKRPHP